MAAMGAGGCSLREANVGQFEIKLAASHRGGGVDSEFAVIPCASSKDGETLEQAARLLAAQAEKAAVDLFNAGVEANGGGQLLFLRALHYYARRADLLYAAAAVREADVNNPAAVFTAAAASSLPVGAHQLLMPLPLHECLNLGQDPGGLGREDPEDDAPAVTLAAGYTYIFQLSEGNKHMLVRRMSADDVSVDFAAGQSPSGLGTWTVNGVQEEIFIKEKTPEMDGGGMPLLMRQVALEAATCATLGALDCFVRIRAVQVLEDRVRMLFDKLPGRSFDDFLEVLEGRKHRATESEILGGVLLTLGAHMQLNRAGFNQRDAKSENLWLSVSKGMLQVVITDSEAVFKDGHLEDAHMVGLGNEVWQLRALRDRKLWKFGGSTFSRAVSVFTANMDLQCKQCAPGEQAIVYSLSEIILRMMGEGERVWACGDDARWEDAIKASVSCDLFSDSEDEEDEDGGHKTAAPAKPAKQASASSVYSAKFLDLVMTLRRRSFTQGGVDAFLDLGQALQLCRDHISLQLRTTEASCLADFARLVGRMEGMSATSTAVPQQQQQQQQHGSATGTANAANAEAEAVPGQNPPQAAPPQAAPDSVAPRQTRPWSEVSEKDMQDYYVCPVADKVERSGITTFEVVGLALRRRNHTVKFGSDVELYMRGPHTPSDTVQPVCFANLTWWRCLPEFEEIVLGCLRRRSHELPDLSRMLTAALETACQHPLRVHSEALCFHLELSREHLSRGYQGLADSSSLVVIYPFTDELKLAVIERMRELSKS